MNVKEQAMKLIESLPDDVTWEDLLYEFNVRRSIEAGIADAQADRVMDVIEVRAKWGLSS
jgi:hypothetical protein